LEVRVYRSDSELQEVREFWSSSQAHPNSDHEHFLLVCGLRPNVTGPCVIAVWDEGKCRCLVVGRRERTTIQPTLGYARLPGVSVTAITVIHAGVIGTLEAPAAAAVASQVDELLRQGYADVAIVNSLPEEAPLWQALSARRSRYARRLGWSTHRELILQHEPGFLLRSMRSKHRSWVKRKERELDAAFPGKVSWLWYRDASDVSGLCAKMEMVANATYQRGLGAGFVNDTETRERLILFARRGQLRIFLVEVDGIPKAFWLGEVYRGVFHSAATGYSPDMRDFEVGTLVFLRMVDKLAEEGVARLDFGLGDAHYKERFGNRAWREATIQIFSPSIRSALLGRLLRACDYIDHLSRNAVSRLGVADQLKQIWRRRLAKKAGSQEHQ
jgi:hypothetical protein